MIITFLLFLQTDVPLKPTDEFECKPNLSFRTRSYDKQPLVDYTETVSDREKRLSNSPLPYLKLNLAFHKLLPSEIRMQVFGNNKLIKTKKLVNGELIELDLGFTDDIKDGINPREYSIYTQAKNRSFISKITISFTEDGDYFVNGIKRGRI